jgi:hypothetical protein
MRRERLHLGSGLTVETGTDINGRFFIATARDCAMYFRCADAMRKFLRLPPKTPSRESLDSWLVSLDAEAA